ncbi:MAG: DUF790 family protein [Candidatus Bathyarchaeota archaeon]|nr:MAG: DUF790 family protein [Candidatus Bathyarchaeota archaeon]
MPSSLLIARKWRDTIKPVYARLTQENLEAARLLTQTYESYVGKTKGELDEAVEGMEENLGYDYRYVRGLSTLLNRRCQLEPRATINPIQARRQVFKIAHKTGFPTTPEERRTILHQAAEELEVAMEELDESLYGDLENELTLKDFKPINEEALVRQYNLSLTQTLLFYSTELTFTTIGNWQHIFKQIKWLGLIYTISRSNRGYSVKVDGPASLFKLNRRYGTSLAKLLPVIIQNQRWNIKAKILRFKGDRRLLNLELDSEKHGGIMKSYELTLDAENYDSKVEKDFAVRFKALHTGWKLIREPEPISVGRRVMIPDFRFQKSSLRVYLEVMGFWTPRYLQEKLRKLADLGDVDMIVAANRKLACRKLDKIGEKLNVIYYKQRIPLKPILVHLRSKKERLMNEQIERLRTEVLRVENPVVEAKELAEKLEVLEEAIKSVLKEQKIPGYALLGDMLIKETKLEEIQEKLENRLRQGDLSLDEASTIIEDIGGRNPANLLDALDYKVEWHGINPRSTIIRRKSIT